MRLAAGLRSQQRPREQAGVRPVAQEGHTWGQPAPELSTTIVWVTALSRPQPSARVSWGRDVVEVGGAFIPGAGRSVHTCIPGAPEPGGRPPCATGT